MSTIAVTPPRRVLADLVPASLLANVALVVGAAAFVGLLAQLQIPHNPVPFTGQTLGVMLAGSALGWRRAGLAMALYVLLGSIGLPWFAGHASGHAMASFGYLVGFVIAGPVLGWLASRGVDRRVSRAVVAMAVGDAIIFAIGVPWLKYSAHYSWSYAIHNGFTVFVVAEIVKAVIAGVALPSAWRLVDRTTRARSN
jgi:biotin transport system substrate-specific component